MSFKGISRALDLFYIVVYFNIEIIPIKLCSHLTSDPVWDTRLPYHYVGYLLSDMRYMRSTACGFTGSRDVNTLGISPKGDIPLHFF